MSPTSDPAAPGPVVPDRAREDACPGALRLHTADDGALARVRLPGGLLTLDQVVTLAEAAELLGDGHLETTSRGNVQLRGLPEDCGLELGTRLRAAGLLPSDRHERVRNIVASPLSGVDGNGRADTRTWTRELDTALCAADWSPGLSGRFLFALDDGRGDVAGLDADVTLIATAGGGALLRLGRSATALRVPAGREVEYALRAAEAFLELLRASGVRAWRIREADPDGALLGARLGLAAQPLPAEPTAAGPLPAGPRGSRSGAGALPRLGVIEGPDGRYGLSVGLRFGRVSAAQWRLLAEAGRAAGTAAGDGEGELRVTPWRGVVIPALTAGAARDRAARLSAAGLGLDPGSPWTLAMACTGTPGCAKSLADVRGEAARALEAAAAGGPSAARLLPVHWSGCERRCGHPLGEWVDVLATGDGYEVSVRRPPSTTGSPDSPQRVTTQQMAEAVAEARRTT
ncbi:precorrin-3B synthase [Kitasatospora sp. NPDC050543]|uniref:precorrin-3B synthase n=1 Tax=Kitasatospora sp. NPDC050543 TaxID=3364054 RepID=UPI0037BAE0B7